MVYLDTELLDLNLRVVLLNLKQPLLQKQLQFPFQHPLPILRNPYDVILMIIRTVGTESYLHPLILTARRAKPLRPFGGFHPRAYAQGPQPGI